MKKLFIVALAAFGMVACMNEEITELPAGNEITFDNAFIDNATRAELTAGNMSEFKVWGYIDGLGDANDQSVVLFEGVDVTNASGAWQYTGGARYWAPGEHHYFEAVAPTTTGAVSVETTPEDGKVTTITYTVDGESDLIYAAYDVTAKAAGQENGAVSFTFNHLLSKVNFTFNNTFAAADGISINVYNVKMTVPASGSYNVATGTWTVDATTGKTLTNIEGAKFVLPYGDSYAYAIEFDVDVTYKDVVINKGVHKTSTVMVALEKGKAYNFTADIDADALDMENIEFIVGEVDEWGTTNNVELPAAVINGTPYATIEEALDNLADGQTLTLNKNVVLDADKTQTISGKSVTIDLNGKTLRAKSNDDTETKAEVSGNREMFLVKNGSLTVTNGTIEYKHEGENMGWGGMSTIFDITAGGKVVLNGVTAKNLGGTDMAFVAHLNNWGEATLEVDESTLESTYIAVRAFNSGNDMNNITITNSTLKGKYCFWVHNYKAAGDSIGTDATLDIDILNGTNTFEFTGKAPILYGFANPIYYTANGNIAVNSAADLQAVVDAATGNTNIELVADIEGDVTIAEKADTNIVIFGQEKKYDGTIKIHTNSTRNSGTVTIKNVNFETETADEVFVEALENGSERYSQNITIENCDFVAVEDSAAVYTAAGVSVKATQNFKMVGCTATNMHSLLQAQSCDEKVTVENVTVTNGKNGIAFGNTAYPTLKNATINATYYGVRADGNASRGNLKIENTTINATQPIVVRKATTAKYAVQLGENVTLNTEETYQVVFTTGSDDAAYVAPADANYSITGAEGVIVYPINVPITPSTDKEFTDAINDAVTNGNGTVVLAAGTYKLPSTAATYTITGTEDTKIDVTSGLSYAAGADVTFEGITIQSVGGTGYEYGFADMEYATFNNCVINGSIGLDFSCEFNNCTFNIEGNNYNVWTWGAGTATFNGCTFNCDGKAMLVYANVLDNGTYHQTVNITNCTFNDNGDDTVTGKAAIEISNTYTPVRTYDVIITNTEVKGFAQTVPSSWDFNAAYGSVEGSNLGTNVWGNKCQLPNTQINVVIDGVDVY